MLTFQRGLAASVSGMLAGGAIIFGTAVGLASLYPHRLFPVSLFALLLGGQATGSFVAGGVATLVARRHTMFPALCVGAGLTACWSKLPPGPHPIWFAVASFLAFLPIALAGGFVFREQ